MASAGIFVEVCIRAGVLKAKATLNEVVEAGQSVEVIVFQPMGSAATCFLEYA